MKINLTFLKMMVIAGILAVVSISCKKTEDPIPPTVRFLAEIDADNGYTVNLTLESTNASTFEWDYGDENTSNESVSHSYTYNASGEYEITVTATGDGGDATDSKTVTIVSSLEEIIAGSDNNGKTWVLTQAEGTYPGKIGVTPVGDMAAPDPIAIPSGIIAAFGLGDEYPDEFTFYKDGTFKVDVKNNQALAGVVYGAIIGTAITNSSDPSQLPFCAIPYQNITDATWALSYDDKTVTAFNEFTTAAIEDVTFTFGDDSNVANLVLSTGAYIGLADLFYPVTPEMGITEIIDNSFYIIKEVTPEFMQISIAMMGVPFLDDEGNPAYNPTNTPIFMYPSMMINLIFEPKAK